MDPELIAQLETVSYAELSELILLTLSTMIEQLTVFLTALFAYFAVAYLVAKKLSVFQLVAVTVVYSAFEFIAMYGIWSLSARLGELLQFRDGEVPLALFGSTLVCMGAWILSIIFMIHSRQRTEG